MEDKLEKSNIFKIYYDEEYFYINFARVAEFRDNLTDDDVDDLKQIKLEAKFMSGFMSNLIDMIQHYENENNIKILNNEE